MNFFEHQEQARKRTGRLVFLYGVAVGLIMLAIYAVILGVLYYYGAPKGDTLPTLNWWNPEIFISVCIGALAIIGGGTLYKIKELSGGGTVVAEMLGGVPVKPDTTDFHERRLLNVVEEMAVASGIPVPTVFILPDEEGINAFAAGFTPQDAVVGITGGGTRLLTREELQGVIAHEFSHILNGDMRLNIRLMGILHGILLIALIGYGVLRMAMHSGGRARTSSRNDKKNGGGTIIIVLLGLGLMIIGYIGVFFGKLIKSAVSRQREYLADASAVQFTRNPGGIAGALKKIGGFISGSRLNSPKAEEASHLYFANGIRNSFLELLATHPPLHERISRIDPEFNGKIPSSDTIEAAAQTDQQTKSAMLMGLTSATDQPPSLTKRIPISPAGMRKQVGTLDADHLKYATEWLSQVPDELRHATREPTGAQAVAYTLLLAKQTEIRARQLHHLASSVPGDMYQAILAQAVSVAMIPIATRLSLASLALPALRNLTPENYRGFRENMFFLASADMEIDLFEYTLMRMLARHLDPLFGKAAPTTIRYTNFKEITAPCHALLATLAWFGQAEETTAAKAFAKGLEQLLEIANAPLPPQANCTLIAFDKALESLVAAAPLLKSQIINACTACCAADGFITLEEGEMLRAVADALDCPIPPIISQIHEP